MAYIAAGLAMCILHMRGILCILLRSGLIGIQNGLIGIEIKLVILLTIYCYMPECV